MQEGREGRRRREGEKGTGEGGRRGKGMEGEVKDRRKQLEAYFGCFRLHILSRFCKHSLTSNSDD